MHPNMRRRNVLYILASEQTHPPQPQIFSEAQVERTHAGANSHAP